MSLNADNRVELRAGNARAVVDGSLGARLSSLEVDGLELLVDAPDAQARVPALSWGCYPMVPWTGRMRGGCFSFGGHTHQLAAPFEGHAIHGVGWNRAWERDGDARFRLDLGSEWPYEGHAIHELRLDADRLRLRLEVHAEEEAFPATLGWHPWFRRRLARGGEARLEFSATEVYEADQDGISTGALGPVPAGPWDACFAGVSDPPRLRWPGALALELRCPVTDWVVYDRPRDALCVEPMTGPPNALEFAPRIVEPGGLVVGEFELIWADAPQE